MSQNITKLIIYMYIKRVLTYINSSQKTLLGGVLALAKLVQMKDLWYGRAPYLASRVQAYQVLGVSGRVASRALRRPRAPGRCLQCSLFSCSPLAGRAFKFVCTRASASTINPMAIMLSLGRRPMLLLLLGMASAAAAPTAERPWLDATLPVAERVAALLPKMTRDEKIAMTFGAPARQPALCSSRTA